MPRLPDIPRDLPPHHQQFYTEMFKYLSRVNPSEAQAPGRPSNVTVRPLPGGNEITWTFGDSADSHIIMFSDQPTWDPTKVNNHVISVANSTHYTHNVGQAGKTFYYWVVAQRGRVKSDPPTGPVSGTTLALNVAAADPVYVPAGAQIVKNRETKKSSILTTQRGGGRSTT